MSRFFMVHCVNLLVVEDPSVWCLGPAALCDTLVRSAV